MDPRWPAPRSPWWRSGLVVGLVVLLGALGTGLSTVALRVTAQSWSERAFAQKQDVIAKVIVAELIQYGVALADLSASIGAQPRLTAGGFAAITAPFNNSRLPGATEISFVVPATAATMPVVQADWRARGSAGLTLTAGNVDGEHYFPVLGRALDGGSAEIGDDLLPTTDIVTALQSARADGGVVTSSTYPSADGIDRSFVMAAAVVSTGTDGKAGEFLGWITMAFRGSEFLGPAPGLIGGDQVSIEFTDVSGETPVRVASWASPARAETVIAPKTVELPFPPKQWRLTVRPTVALLPATEAWLAHGAAAIGSVLTLLLASLTATVVTSRDRALRRVDQATLELRYDIARRESVELQLRKREEELTGFAGVVAHDLRSPLANVLGYAELIADEDDGSLSAYQRDNLARLRKSADRMRMLIDDLLAYATADHTVLRHDDVDLNLLVDSILTERLDGTSSGAQVNHASLPTVRGDESQIRQVLDNLIGNAIKYTPPERAAEISIGATLEVTLGEDMAAPAWHRIEVADRGIGIPEDQRAEVFHAFIRAAGSEDFPGTGLGLAIVQRIIERHGGTVGVDGNPGGGSRFWFTLPA
ncbi:ATP-binding protein [Actinoplanes sp. NPDC051859]|uniref:ATP-binding protein n=1 Tax=Actinoplanes sp. NPDC051859 TaxID=3363909 RepID=UPI00378ACF41